MRPTEYIQELAGWAVLWMAVFVLWFEVATRVAYHGWRGRDTHGRR